MSAPLSTESSHRPRHPSMNKNHSTAGLLSRLDPGGTLEARIEAESVPTRNDRGADESFSVELVDAYRSSTRCHWRRSRRHAIDPFLAEDARPPHPSRGAPAAHESVPARNDDRLSVLTEARQTSRRRPRARNENGKNVGWRQGGKTFVGSRGMARWSAAGGNAIEGMLVHRSILEGWGCFLGLPGKMGGAAVDWQKKAMQCKTMEADARKMSRFHRLTKRQQQQQRQQ